jgi:hypothetical protein
MRANFRGCGGISGVNSRSVSIHSLGSQVGLDVVDTQVKIRFVSVCFRSLSIVVIIKFEYNLIVH